MSLQPARLGPVGSFGDVSKALQDIQLFIDQVFKQCPALTDDPPAAGTIEFVVREDDGTYHLWSLAAGAGVTLTPNFGTRILTATSP